MGREYEIVCSPAAGADLQQLFRRLPAPFHRPRMVEIYHCHVDGDGCYFVDRLVDRTVAAVTLRIFLDAALAAGGLVTVIEP